MVNLKPSVGIAFEVKHGVPSFPIEWPRHIQEQKQKEHQQRQHTTPGSGQVQAVDKSNTGTAHHRDAQQLTQEKEIQRRTTPRSQLSSWPTASELVFMHAGGRGISGPPRPPQADSAVMDAVDKLRGVVEGPPCYALALGCAGAAALNSDRSVNVSVLLDATSTTTSGKHQTEALVAVTEAAFSRVLTEKQMTTHSLLHTKRVGGGVGWPRVDGARFPKYAHARGWAFTVKAGDTLYIPAYWWHWVRSDGSPAVAVNVWTNRPHRNIFEPGCGPNAEYKCGRVPTLIPGAAASWPARTKWTLPFIRAQYYRARETEAAAGKPAPELLGTCASSDSIYPEMWGTRVMGVSPWHIRGAPPKPKAFGDFAAVIENKTLGDVCHLHLPLEHMPADMMQDISMPQGNRPPSAGAEAPVSMNLWITGGSLQSGLHFDTHYNSLTVLAGTKTIFLFPPTETKYLYKVGNVAADTPVLVSDEALKVHLPPKQM